MTILSFLVYLLFSNALFSRTKTAWLLFSVCLCLALFASLIDTGKGQLIFLLFGLLITYLLSKDKKANFRSVAIFVVILLLLSSIMMVFFMGTDSDNYWDLFSAVFGRIYSGNMIPAYHVLDMFQNQDYLWGRSFPNPRGIFPFEQFVLDNEVWLRIYPQPPGSELQYAAPSVFWAEMYANFGPIGPLLSAPFVGIMLYWFQSMLSRLPSNPIKFALTAWCSIHFMGLAAKSLLAYVVLDYDLYIILALALLLLLLDGKGKFIVYKTKVARNAIAP
jgi:oligosaccharide repeat unit polymerase